jgi:hypothetical protein
VADRPDRDADPAPDPDLLDDDALSWEGDEQLGRATSLTGAGSARDVPRSDRAIREEQRSDAARTPVRTGRLAPAHRRDVPLLIATVLFGLAYAAYEVAWIVVIQRVGGQLAANSGGGIASVLANATNFLALLASALWFVIAVHLTRGGRRVHRIGFLALGLGVLLPWPWLSGLIA